MIEGRGAEILRAVIQEFIEEGEPVSSSALFRRHRFGIRPASIRNELHELTEQGFLEQPYHSAGRIPTDLGYQLFADAFLQEETRDISMPRTWERFAEAFRRKRWREFIERLSGTFGLMGVLHDAHGDEVHKAGLAELIYDISAESRDEIRQIVEDIEKIEDNFGRRRTTGKNSSHIRVFIGEGSPFTRSSELAVVEGMYRDEEGEPILLLAIGPKRMDYRGVIGLFKKL